MNRTATFIATIATLALSPGLLHAGTAHISQSVSASASRGPESTSRVFVETIVNGEVLERHEVHGSGNVHYESSVSNERAVIQTRERIQTEDANGVEVPAEVRVNAENPEFETATPFEMLSFFITNTLAYVFTIFAF